MSALPAPRLNNSAQQVSLQEQLDPQFVKRAQLAPIAQIKPGLLVAIAAHTALATI